MDKHKSISVVIPAYNEEKSIQSVIRDFSKPYVSEIIVVDNNSTDKTAELARKSGAKVVTETNQGYGFALQRGMREAKGDIIILTEADCTFVGKDMEKLLIYIDDVDMVLGTRLTRELTERNAKMDWFLTWGNLFIAKLIQLKFWGKTRLTDVGCTFRAIKKDALKKILNKFKVGGPHFSPEMIIVALENNLKTVEIPVHYLARVGESKITANKWKSFKVGLKMLGLILFN
jgi:glycosyltransferase involved in cell wall biosynthesis